MTVLMVPGCSPTRFFDDLLSDQQGVAVADERRIGEDHVAVERVDHVAAFDGGGGRARGRR